jgi:UPF0755 protein
VSDPRDIAFPDRDIGPPDDDSVPTSAVPIGAPPIGAPPSSTPPSSTPPTSPVPSGPPPISVPRGKGRHRATRGATPYRADQPGENRRVPDGPDPGDGGDPGPRGPLPAGYGSPRGRQFGHRLHTHDELSRGGRRHHPILFAFVVLLVVIAVVAVGGFFWAKKQINPGRPGPTVSVVIPEGYSTSQIASLFASAGVIKSSSLFKYYVKLEGDGPFFPGTYQLPKNSSYSSVIAAIDKPPVVLVDKLTIPEGYTLNQIAAAVAALPGLHLSAQKFVSAASSGQVRSPYEPAGVNNLEGLLFPATYDISQGETEVDVLEKMVGAFDTQAQQLGLTATSTVDGRSAYQVITVASIVEREAKLTADRGPTASVIYNRLKAGMTLGADSTQTYYLRLTNPTVQPTLAQLEQPSAYNTRLNKGLPPTPIANAGIPSLQAAIDPPSTAYLFFVEINPDGKLGFATNNAGFTQLQEQCRAAHLC